MPTATVTVTLQQNADPTKQSSYDFNCAPPQVTVNKGSVDATITFNFNQVNTTGWRFLTVGSTGGNTDHFYGVTITNDTTGEFYNPGRTSDSQVQFTDKNDITTTYTYTVGIDNPGLGLTLGNDPTIDNQGR